MEILLFSSYINLILIIMESNSSQTSSIFSYNPLFSSIVTLYILIFLYFPFNSLKLIVSLILISTLILLLSLLRLGTSQQTLQQKQQSHANIVEPEPESEPKPQPQLEPEYEYENESESESKSEPWPQNESESEPEPGLSQTYATFGTQTSIEPKPKPEHKLEPSLKSGLSQEEEKVRTYCDRDEIQLINNPGLEPEIKQIISKDITNKEDEQRHLDPAIDPFPYSTGTFVGWAVCAPLEVICESYEGEQDVDMYVESDSNMDTDTGSSSTWEEEEKEGMFEIALDHGYGDYNKCVFEMKKLKNEFEVDEEDNLIEIDITF